MKNAAICALMALLLCACGASNRAASSAAIGIPKTESKIRAGVGVVDMTPDVGYCAGQYCADGTDTVMNAAGGDEDPYLTHKTKDISYGVQSRLSARAIVVEGSNGKRVALLKTDNYLAQDLLVRRVAQILDQGKSGIGYAQILYGVTHNHSAAYSSTLAPGPWVFEDAYDARFFENQARKMAQAIETAAANLAPARLGATVMRHVNYKGNVVRLNTADDGTPAGYPLEYNDHQLIVLRFDDVSGDTPKPLALWINFGQHGEGNAGYSLHSADFIGPLERFVERDTGAPLVFSQGDVGSSENSGNKNQMLADDGSVCGAWPEDAPAPVSNQCAAGQGVVRDFDHKGYAANERNVRFLADDVVKAVNLIGAGDASVTIPFTADFPVEVLNAWVPGPLSHPYPSVSNCRSETTLQGHTGAPVLGLPDCFRDVDVPGDNPISQQLALIAASARAEGVPVPDHYDALASPTLEENLRLKLQAVRLGDILLASCACEAQNDLILNLKSRADTVAGNIYDGFDWACLLPGRDREALCQQQRQYYDPAEFPTAVPGDNFSDTAVAHLRAQVHNDARGWDAPENSVAANSEPSDVTKIRGNFTREEIQDLGAPGYKLVVGIGHAGDYNGYTISYREYMNRDSYRKALTAYGPHTADYMVTRLIRMAAQLQGGAKLAAEPHDLLAQADEQRQQAIALAHGQFTRQAYDVFYSALAADLGAPAAIEQPQNLLQFNAATFSWIGGSTAVDNPSAKVQRLVGDAWTDFADMSGEVQTRVHWPQGIAGSLQALGGQFEWRWSANFEAYKAFPARLGDTPPGTYRFVVAGCSNAQDFASNLQRIAGLVAGSQCRGSSVAYELTSDPFSVSEGAPRRSYESRFPFIHDNDSNRVCDQCSFRPWMLPAK